jgi:preprotein translocase subunit SecG
MSAFFAIVLTLLAIFLILLVLVQRGRGGGLAGALGGMGGSSAFGAKAGDVFTRITIITAAIWIVISIIAFFWAAHRGDALGRASASAPSGGSPASNEPLDVLKQPKAGETPATTVIPPADKSDTAPATTEPAAEINTLPPTGTQAIESDKSSETSPPAATEPAPPATSEPAAPAENK